MNGDGQSVGALSAEGGSHQTNFVVSVLVGVFDMMGGKPGCNYGHGDVSPTITRGRASVSDVHAVVMAKEDGCV